MALSETWQWDEVAFIRAWEGDVFGGARVELVEGEVWPVSIGAWHGSVAANLIRALPNDEWPITTSTLPASGSVPDPDAWVHHRDARPIARLGSTGRILRWNPGDVALVVEIAETSFAADTETKARVYGRAGFATYWVIHRGGVQVFTEPDETGYRSVGQVDVDGFIQVPYASTALDVAIILNADG
jgi:hypothetical protein